MEQDIGCRTLDGGFLNALFRRHNLDATIATNLAWFLVTRTIGGSVSVLGQHINIYLVPHPCKDHTEVRFRELVQYHVIPEHWCEE